MLPDEDKNNNPDKPKSTPKSKIKKTKDGSADQKNKDRLICVEYPCFESRNKDEEILWCFLNLYLL